MNANEVKIKLRGMLAKARQDMFLSQSGTCKESYYEGKATAFAEVIELIEELGE